MTDVNVLRMEDGRVEACLIWESTGTACCMQVRKENLEITRTRQYIESNLVPVQIGVQPKSIDKSNHGKDKDLADAEGKPVTANTRPSTTAADAPLADDYVTTFSRDSATCQKKITVCTCQDRDNDEI